MDSLQPDSSRTPPLPNAQPPQKKYQPLTRCGFLGSALVATVFTILNLFTTIFSALAAAVCLGLNKTMNSFVVHNAKELGASFLYIPLSCLGIICPHPANKWMGRTEQPPQEERTESERIDVQTEQSLKQQQERINQQINQKLMHRFMAKEFRSQKPAII